MTGWHFEGLGQGEPRLAAALSLGCRGVRQRAGWGAEQAHRLREEVRTFLSDGLPEVKLT